MDGPLINPVKDNTGRIFISNQGSVYVYNRDGKVNTVQVYDYGDDRLSYVTDFCKDEQDNIWIVCAKGICANDKDKNTYLFWLSIAPGGTNNGLTKINLTGVSQFVFWNNE
ncbi:MAG: hypothetical protein ABI472_22305 [Ginsengibacter sp.]